MAATSLPCRMPESAIKRLRVAIIGAGIGGLTLSAALGFMDPESELETTIYEAATTLSAVGAGINFWTRTWRVMQEIGLQGRLLALLPNEPDTSTSVVFHFRKGDQSSGVSIRDIKMKGGAIRFYRAELQQALLGGSTGQLRLAHRLIDYHDMGNELKLIFENGTTAWCDVLVGADGIKSSVRKRFLEKAGLPQSPSYNPVWSGEVAYRGLVPVEQLQAEYPGHRVCSTPMLYCGKGKHIVAYLMSHLKLLNVAVFVSDLSKKGTNFEGPTAVPCSADEVLSQVRGWEPEVQALVRCMKSPTKWAIHTVSTMDRYASGRVFLAGDAAHAMIPHQGAGAGRAVEDAYVLASLLTDKLVTKTVIPTLSEIYNTICCPSGNKVMESSLAAGKLCQLSGPESEDIGECDTVVSLSRLTDFADAIEKKWEWAWKEGAEDDRRQAIVMLETSLGH